MSDISASVREYLKPCPSSPNCVSSVYQNDEKHFMAPWRYEGEFEQVRKILIQLLESSKGATVETHGLDYIHATFRIPLFGFIDDVRFYIDREGELIHFRSSSRKGHSDLGVNKRRMQKLRDKLSERIALSS